ncbi:MAG: alpha/beta hydrolase [Hyphomicrobiaceae bacterium]
MTATPSEHGFLHAGGSTGFLLIHGLSGTPVELRYVANGLARRGHTVSCPRLAGHCGTIEDLQATTWQDWYASVEDALLELSRRCEKVFVGGLSMGAILALRAAELHPDLVAGSVLYAPTLWLDGWGVPWYSRLFTLVRDKITANLIPFSERPPYGIKDKRLRALIAEAIHSGDPSKAGFLSIPGGPMLELRWLVNAVKRDLAQVTRPVLILHPREDDRASLRNTSYLASHLGGRVETVVLEDSYHVITVDRQRDVVLEKTAAFAEAVAGATAATKPNQILSAA